jgi:hypothetical protein
MQDLDIIVNILCNYYKQYELNRVEMVILCDWLNESQANENFLTELSDDAPWIRDSSSIGIHHLIRSKLILLYRQC